MEKRSPPPSAHLQSKNLEFEMPQYNDLTGQKFNRLLALYPTTHRNKSGQVIWTFRCDCGTEKELPGPQVARGAVRSCGCLLRETSRERQRLLSLRSAERNTRQAIKALAIAKDIRAARMAKRWTQSNLADAAGYTLSAIQRLETGKTRSSAHLLQDCATALGYRLKLEQM